MIVGSDLIPAVCREVELVLMGMVVFFEMLILDDYVTGLI